MDWRPRWRSDADPIVKWVVRRIVELLIAPFIFVLGGMFGLPLVILFLYYRWTGRIPFRESFREWRARRKRGQPTL